MLDLVQVLLCFGDPATGACGTGQDINQDGVINVLDLVALLLAFGTACPPTCDVCDLLKTPEGEPICGSERARTRSVRRRRSAGQL